MTSGLTQELILDEPEEELDPHKSLDLSDPGAHVSSLLLKANNQKDSIFKEMLVRSECNGIVMSGCSSGTVVNDITSSSVAALLTYVVSL